MAQNDLPEKLNGILEAIAAGRSCEQILAADRKLSYHDIFHAVAEAPTGFWTNLRQRADAIVSRDRPIRSKVV